jgi:hypothetical protein
MTRSRRRSAIAIVALGAIAGAVGPAAAWSTAACWRPPVDAVVRDPFRLPACTWCPGNRGIEYATAPGDPVRAVAAGTVSFAGTVAGVRYVVVRLPDGRRVTYGRLAGGEPSLRAGDVVVSGQLVGRAGDDGFLLGVRAPAPDDTYLDPSPWIGEPSWPARLVPLDGTPPRPGPARVRCEAATTSPE